MGAWGYGILDSDDGYDVVDEISIKTELSFEYLIEGFYDLESENRKIMIEKLSNENIWKELIYNEDLSQFIIFSLYVSLGLSEFIEKITINSNKNIKESVAILKKQIYNFEEEKYPELKSNIDLVFESFYNKKPFSVKSKSLLECLNN